MINILIHLYQLTIDIGMHVTGGTGPKIDITGDILKVIMC